jgi:hypothetical protein
MGTKSKRDYNDPLSIWNIMAAADKKDYDYYDRLNDDQKKEFSPYLIMRWFSNVDGNGDISKYYIIAVNEFVNNCLWDISKHKKLSWLCICFSSPNVGKQKHGWLGAAKGKKTNTLKNKIMELLPNTKESDIDLLMKVHTTEEIKEWLKLQCGIEEKSLKLLA